mgnify:FL=1
MTIEYPIFLYKCPGNHVGSQGTTYNAELAETESEHKALKQNGYHVSMQDAIDAFKGVFKPVESVEETLPSEEPVNDEKSLSELKLLKIEAEELGIEVDRRWGVKTLQEKINKAKGA